MKNKIFSIMLLMTMAAFPVQSPNIGNTRVFPADNPWNWDISGYQVHPNSANFITSIGASTHLHPDFGTAYGIPYVSVNSSQAKIPVNYTAYGNESDPGPFPIPLSAPVEGGLSSTGDRHVISVDTSNKMLYELYTAYPQAGQWDAGCGAKYDLTSNAMRPAGWTSADAAGLPIFPGLVRYEEVYIKGQINHAIRFTIVNSQKAYLWPARHYASSSTDPNRPPMGLRFRLKATFDVSPFSAPVQVILNAFKKYGIIVADNGSNWYITGAPDDRWDDDILGELKTIAGSNFEAVLTVDNSGNPIYPIAVELEPVTKGALSINAFPNPFSREIEIALALPLSGKAGILRAGVYDIQGRLIRAWQAADFSAKGLALGIAWNGTDGGGRKAQGGIYFIRVETRGGCLNKPVLLMR